MIYSVIEIIGYILGKNNVYQNTTIIEVKEDKIIDVELIEDKKTKKKKSK